jgi:CPA1 family monovalent cation:H+ antiporter
MFNLFIALALLLFAIALGWLASRTRTPYPIVLVLGGVGLGFVPGLPAVSFEPQLLLVMVLPPILYQAAFSTSWRDFKANRRAIGMLAIGLVVATTLSVGAVLKLLVPDIPWAIAFAFGAIVSPPDAVAATAILSRLSIPRRIVTILEGESLVNDASGLVLYKIAIVAALTGSFSLMEATGEFVWVATAGIAIGLAVAWVSVPATRAVKEPLLQCLVSIAVPYAAFLVSEVLHVSGVLAVVAAGLARARSAAVIATPESRIMVLAMWNFIVFTLNSFIFMLIGWQLRGILDRISGFGLGELLAMGLALSGAAIAVRFLWVFPATYLPRFLSASLRRDDPYPAPNQVFVTAWCGMRGIVSLAVALALPLTLHDGTPFPYRDLLIFLTFAVIAVTLVGQGLTLAPVIRALKVGADWSAHEEERGARLAVANAAMRGIDRFVEKDGTDAARVAHLRQMYLDERDAQMPRGLVMSEEADIGRKARRAALHAQRNELLELWRSSKISDEVFHKLERELDYQQSLYG